MTGRFAALLRHAKRTFRATSGKLCVSATHGGRNDQRAPESAHPAHRNGNDRHWLTRDTGALDAARPVSEADQGWRRRPALAAKRYRDVVAHLCHSTRSTVASDEQHRPDSGKSLRRPSRQPPRLRDDPLARRTTSARAFPGPAARTSASQPLARSIHRRVSDPVMSVWRNRTSQAPMTQGPTSSSWS